MPKVSIGTVLYQFVFTMFKVPDAIRFLREHRLWQGFSKYGWLSRFLLAVGVLLSIKLGSVVFDWWQQLFGADTAALSLTSMGGMFSETVTDGYELFTAGYMKYVILILLEVVVFHIMRGTLTILTGRAGGTSLREFVHAQVRMVKVVLRAWVLELILTILVSVIFGIFGVFEVLEGAFVFLIQCYFLGFVILDNYNEQFGLTIKESDLYARDYIGVSLALGFLLYVLLLVPILGAVVGPVLVSVLAAIVMVEQGDLHLRPVQEAAEQEGIAQQEGMAH